MSLSQSKRTLCPGIKKQCLYYNSGVCFQCRVIKMKLDWKEVSVNRNTLHHQKEHSRKNSLRPSSTTGLFPSKPSYASKFPKVRGKQWKKHISQHLDSTSEYMQWKGMLSPQNSTISIFFFSTFLLSTGKYLNPGRRLQFAWQKIQREKQQQVTL